MDSRGKVRNKEGAVDLSRLSFLVIDDNHFIRQLIVQMLRAFRVSSISEANDAADALKLLRTHKFDLILCDYLMSPLNGVDFTRLVRTAKDSKDQEVPIIMITGHTAYEDVIHMRNAGINELLVKPLSAQSLLGRIVYVFEKPREFVRSDVYTGPDRRRQFAGVTEDRRGKRKFARSLKKSITSEGVEVEDGWGLSKDEISELLGDANK